MTATNTHSTNNTAEAQFLAPQTHQPASEGETAGTKASGYGFEWGGRVYDRAQITAALRCAEGIFTAYARASEALGLGSQSVQWADLDIAFDHATDALSDGLRERIDAECVAQYHGVEMNGNGIVVQTVDTDGEMEVASASIDDEHMQLLLQSSGRLHVKNQDGVDLVLFFDMDQETIVVEIDGNKAGAV